MKNKIDIIIPLYNGYNFFKECFESILNNTTPNTYRIIIINDSSKEEKLLNYLKELESLKQENLIIVNNEINLGFVKSVNKGMMMSKINDVILLNSDTIVTNNWLDKIKTCAYSDSKIATVTPLTNNGTICSIPKWLQDNRIPDGFNIEIFANLIEKNSKKEYLEIPTAVGFCMFIKRSILDKVGYFDEQNYGKGYGEENDFSMRIKTFGYKNVLDDATFIYHKGHMSFSSDDFLRLTEKNSEILSIKYPTYNEDINTFIRKNSLNKIIDNINNEMSKFLNNNIMYFIHSNPYESLGGSEKHTLNMIEIAQDFFNFVFLLYFDKNILILERFIKHNSKETVLLIQFEKQDCSHSEFKYNNLNKIFEEIISFYSIKNIHFQHFLNMPFSLIESAGKLKTKVFITAHDFYLISPYPHLSTNYNIKQSIVSDTEDILSNRDIIQRRNQIEQLIKQYVNIVFFPSDFLRNYFNKYFPKISNKFITINHPYLINEKITFINNINNKKTKKSIAFIGVFTPHKGSSLFTNLVLKNNTLYNYYIFGKIEDVENYNRIKDKVCHKEFSNIIELQKNIKNNDIDLILILSIVPETFSFTLSESFLLNIPIVASNIGALGERLSTNNLGMSFDLNNDINITISNILNTIEKVLKLQLQKNKNFDLDLYNKIAIDKYKKSYTN